MANVTTAHGVGQVLGDAAPAADWLPPSTPEEVASPNHPARRTAEAARPVARHPSAHWRAITRVWPRSLAGQFLLASLVVLVMGMLVIGSWVGQAIAHGVLNRSAALTALYVDSVLDDHLEALARQSHLDADEIVTFDHLLTETPLGRRVVVFKVWSPQGEVLYSPDRRLMGQRFELDGGLARLPGRGHRGAERPE